MCSEVEAQGNGWIGGGMNGAWPGVFWRVLAKLRCRHTLRWGSGATRAELLGGLPLGDSWPRRPSHLGHTGGVLAEGTYSRAAKAYIILASHRATPRPP